MTGRDLRKLVIEISRLARVGHIASALCVCDILAVLYGKVLRAAAPADPDRDRFLLSKGHAALALYCALHLKGWLSRGELETFCRDGTRLGAHPEAGVPGIDWSTGSLGLGLSIGAGVALALRERGSPARVFALLSDAECDEGSTWEAAMFAAHRRLENLVAVVDWNGLQAMGPTREILDIPMEAVWRSFGWDTVVVDGHDERALEQALSRRSGPAPRAVIARTTAGKGVSFMEGKVEWHYFPITDEQALLALRELEGNS